MLRIEGSRLMDIEARIQAEGNGVRGTLCEHCERLCYAEYQKRFYCVRPAGAGCQKGAVEDMEFLDVGRDFCPFFKIRGAR